MTKMHAGQWYSCPPNTIIFILHFRNLVVIICPFTLFTDSGQDELHGSLAAMTPPLSPMTAIPSMAQMSSMSMLPNHLQTGRPANLYTDCYTYPPYADSYMSSSKARPSPYGYPVDYGSYSPRMKGIYSTPRTNNFAYGYDARWHTSTYLFTVDFFFFLISFIYAM